MPRRRMQPQREGSPLAAPELPAVTPEGIDAAGAELAARPAPEPETLPAGVPGIRPPWAGQRREVRMRAVLDVLEARAATGDTDAAKAVLAHYRWAEEMRKGRPALRGELAVNHGVKVLDDLGHGRAGRPQSLGVAALPAGVIDPSTEPPTAEA